MCAGGSHAKVVSRCATVSSPTGMHRLAVGVDISSAMTGFPGFRLGNFTGSASTPPWDCTACADGLFYNRSVAAITDVLRKASLLGAADVALTLHQEPELGPAPATVAAMMAATLVRLRAFAAGS